MIGECNREKRLRVVRVNISGVYIGRSVFKQAHRVHNVLAVKFAMCHCKQCASNEASKLSRGLFVTRT